MDFKRIERKPQGHSGKQSQQVGGRGSGRTSQTIRAEQYKHDETISDKRRQTDRMRQMNRIQQISEQRRITEQERIRRNITREFISPKHIDALERAIRSTNTIIGFRAAGAATLKQMDAGAAPKPHTILDKSLKAGEFGTDDMDSNMVQALAGLVPYREGSEIKGLHLSKKGFQYFSSLNGNPFTIVDIKHKRKYLRCNPTSAEDPFVIWLLENIRLNPQLDYASWFVTGDYDLHDMVLKTSQGAPVPSDSLDETRILTRLSEGVMKQPHGAVQFKFVPDEKSPIQHGPQYNYVAHMMDKERRKPIVGKVADLDLKVALFDGKEWTILDHSMPENLEEYNDQQIEEMKQERRARQAKALERYYKAHGLKLKWTWRDLPEAAQYIRHL